MPSKHGKGRKAKQAPPRALPQGARSAAKKQRDTRRRRRNETVTGASYSGNVGNVTAPNRPGVEFGSSGFKIGQGAQRVCDAGDCDSVRVEGCDIMAGALPAGTSGGSLLGLWDVAGATMDRKSYIAPSRISTRLSNIAGTYALYAFRKLEVMYIPTVGTSDVASASAIGSGRLYGLAILQDANAETTDNPQTLQQLSEVKPSSVATVWRGATLKYAYNGTKVWSTSKGSGPSSGATDSIYQCVLGALWDSAHALTAVAYAGIFRVRYVIDLYRPQEPNQYPALDDPLARRSLYLKLCKEFEERKDEMEIDPLPLRRVGPPPSSPSSSFRGRDQPNSGRLGARNVG